jgi:hypothetical protein
MAEHALRNSPVTGIRLDPILAPVLLARVAGP